MTKPKRRRPKMLSAASVRYLEAKAKLDTLAAVMCKIRLGQDWLKASTKRDEAWDRLSEEEKDQVCPNRIKSYE